MLRSVLRNLQLVNVFPGESWSKTADPTWQHSFLQELIFDIRKVAGSLRCWWLPSKTVYPWKDIFLLNTHLGYYLEVGYICITRWLFVNITQEHKDISFRREAIKTTIENGGVIISVSEGKPSKQLLRMEELSFQCNTWCPVSVSWCCNLAMYYRMYYQMNLKRCIEMGVIDGMMR